MSTEKLTIDYWYDDTIADVDGLSVTFYPNEGIYRGNVYNADGKMIGDYVCSDSVMIQRVISAQAKGKKLPLEEVAK